jgi:hypothetical protein
LGSTSHVSLCHTSPSAHFPSPHCELQDVLHSPVAWRQGSRGRKVARRHRLGCDALLGSRLLGDLARVYQDLCHAGRLRHELVWHQRLCDSNVTRIHHCVGAGCSVHRCATTLSVVVVSKSSDSRHWRSGFFVLVERIKQQESTVADTEGGLTRIQKQLEQMAADCSYTLSKNRMRHATS